MYSDNLLEDFTRGMQDFYILANSLQSKKNAQGFEECIDHLKNDHTAINT